ncbi:alpha/beta-hydrolase [Teratosphaeria nubilosa]|uniref:Alpha/beta-hydrolase n=1 Tax=Teratosphaeria nubilosa TaxID=161662 RepID=A0A6G1KXG0_9PEZI|nr:alpha/beta-hydrolase [Teratosphaeria nubilosa]
MLHPLQTVRMSDGAGVQARIISDEPSKPLLIARPGSQGISTHVGAEASYSTLSDLFKVLVFDLRGSVSEDLETAIRLVMILVRAQWTKDIDELMQWAQPDKAFMVDGSYGGFLTLEYALKYPEHGMANMCITALTDPRTKDHVIAKQLLRLLTAVKLNFECVNAQMGACISRSDFRDRLKEITVLAFLSVGRHDWIKPMKMSEDLAKGLPSATLMVHGRSVHLAALEEKTKYLKDVREWLRQFGVGKVAV